MSTIRVWLLTSALVSAAALAATLLFAAPSAQAGGACRGMPVRDEATTTVVIEQGTCFEPAIVRIEPGSTVTWQNPAGGLPHSVTGANSSWGDYGEVSPGVSVSYDFADEGVYPYFCFLHSGMVGTVVVGDAPEGSDSESVSLSGRAQLARSSATVASSGDGGFDGLWLVMPLSAAVALAMGAGGFVLGTRRARR